MFKLSNLVFAATLFVSVNAKFLATPQDAAGTAYDFIVVGGGAAGSVIASRLSETSAKVLLIEAGGATSGPTESVPFDCTTLTPDKGPWDWNYTVTSQEALGGRSFAYPRGKALGGTTSVNYMIFNPGGSDDFNRMAQIAGNSRWSWNSIQSYRKKLEGFVAPTNKSATSEFILGDHGTTGPIKTTLPLWSTDIDARITTATSQLDGYPFNQDMNSGNEIGIGYNFASIGSVNGGHPIRINSGSAYILPVINRSNLDVLLETQVTKVIQTDTVKGVPVFRGIQFSQGAQQPVYNITAKKEIILSAGAIGTPQILMLSGIGGKTSLADVGIQGIVDLPDVGSNLQDHPLLPYQWYVNSTNTWEATRDSAVLQEWTDMYSQNGTGPMVTTVSNQIGWLRIPQNSSIWEGQPDPSSGPTSGHYELMFANGFLGPLQSVPSTGNFITIIMNLVTPASRGSVTLKTSSPWDSPLIDPAYYSNALDLRMMREALKAAQKFVSAAVFDNYIIKPYSSDAVATDAELEAYVSKWTSTVWHPVGTATISSDGSTTGVVDSKLNVKKVRGLRVVDASVLPWAPSAHPEAPLYIIAEVASDVIKADNGL